jgi:PAS domain S-box-containing protein
LNPEWEKVLGYSLAELEGFNFQNFIHPDDMNASLNALAKLEAQEKVLNFENRFRCKDGSYRWIEWRSIPHGKQIYASARDITERKQHEEMIKNSLREKETLLKEIHHRVKNNMQVISSLLNLQMMRNKDKQVNKALMDCRGRINSMASVHEMLYASNSLSVIDCHKYFSKLTGDILHSYHPSRHRVKLTVDAKGVTLGIQQALPLGLMINEMLSNSLKYGFPENMHGQIMIRLMACEQDMFEFVFSDNGIGIPEDIDWRNTQSLGLNLIVLLAENQLRGTVSLDRAKGTCFITKFRCEEI